MKSVLISTKPKWCEKIANGEKIIEVRKSAPKEVPFKAYIYCTKEKKQDDIIWAGAFGDRGKWNGHIIGEFICDKVEKLEEHIEQGGLYYTLESDFNEQAQLDNWELHDYGKGKTIYGWHISDLKIYDKPKELSEFYAPCPIENKDCENCIRYGKPYDWDFDEKQGLIYCTRRLARPPQSWQYVEEVKV